MNRVELMIAGLAIAAALVLPGCGTAEPLVEAMSCATFPIENCTGVIYGGIHCTINAKGDECSAGIIPVLSCSEYTDTETTKNLQYCDTDVECALSEDSKTCLAKTPPPA